MTDSVHLHLPGGIVALPGAYIAAESITYPSGTVTYHVGFTTLDSTGIAVRSSVVSRHENASAAIRAANRLGEHFAHVIGAAND